MMAIFRKIHVSFWADPYVESLTPEQKYFYLYLLTNDRTTQCGIYEITKKKISTDTGYNTDTVNKLLDRFISHGKIKYSEQTSEIAILNWPKYNDSTSPKVKACISKELKHVKDRVLIQYLYSIDTHTQEEEEKEQEKEQEEDKDVIDIVQCLDIALKDPRWIKASKATKELLEDFNKVLEERGIYKKLPIDYKTHFVNWKKKLPVPSKNKETFSREENQW